MLRLLSSVALFVLMAASAFAGGIILPKPDSGRGEIADDKLFQKLDKDRLLLGDMIFEGETVREKGLVTNLWPNGTLVYGIRRRCYLYPAADLRRRMPVMDSQYANHLPPPHDRADPRGTGTACMSAGRAKPKFELRHDPDRGRLTQSVN